MTGRRRYERKPQPPLPTEVAASAASGVRNTWLVRGGPAGTGHGVVWLLRPMPDGQWPADQSLPRDDSFSWWVRSHCGHEGGAKQWAFYRREDAEQYEGIFRANPCHYTRCQDQKRRGGDR